MREGLLTSMEVLAAETNAEILKSFDGLYMRDQKVINALFEKFEHNRRESMCEHELAELEWRMDHCGARRAWRDDGQVINGRRNLSLVFDTNINEKVISRGSFEYKLYFNRGTREQVCVPVTFRLPVRGREKQPLDKILKTYYDLVINVEHEDVDDWDKCLATRRFFLKVFKYATLPLADAAKFYVNARNIGQPFKEEDVYFTFDDEPFAEFLIWTEYLRQRVEKVRSLRGSLEDDMSVPRLEEQSLVFRRSELDKDRSPQRIIMRILLTCLGDKFYNRDAHAFKANCPNDKVKITIYNFEVDEFLTRPVIALMQMLALYKYLDATDHPFVGLDEISVINLAGSYYLSCVYTTPIIILHNGIWRMFMKLMLDAKISGYKTYFIRDGRDQIEAMPHDQFYRANDKKLFVRGTAEFWLGREIAFQYGENPRRGLNVPKLKINMTPEFYSGLFEHAQLPEWPGHKPALQQMGRSSRVPSPLGGYSTIRAKSRR